jgi:hypothetical protein
VFEALSHEEIAVDKSSVVKVRGVSYDNEDGVSRQDLIAKCRRNDSLTLRADPDNAHDRHAVAVLNNEGAPLGWLKSDARDAASILRGEPVSAKVEKVLGGTRWWHRLLGKERHFGPLIRLTKGEIDWSAHKKHREIAEKVDRLVKDALASEKSSPAEAAIANYEAALNSLVDLNKENPTAAAHRYQEAPINRLTMLLVRQKRGEEALAVFEKWESVRDPVGLTKASREALASV